MFMYGYGHEPRHPATQTAPGAPVNWWSALYGNNNIFPNYRARVHQGSLDLMASLNNISWYRGNPRNNWSAFIGYTAAAADVDIDAVGANGSTYAYNSINYVNQDRGDVKDQLTNLWDGEYEHNAPVGINNNTIARLGDNDNWLMVHGVTVGLGYARKISDKFNIGLEQRFSYFLNDNLDGIDFGQSKDVVSFTTVRLNFNLGSSARRTQPLWWVNPNNFIYNELNRPTHMQLPKPVLPDADNDGVTDQFDLEPNTPAGCPVDTHGVSRDTDGDGVPDCRDKELLTAQNCFPVNADGVGNCPEPACCAELRAKMDSCCNGPRTACNISSLPSVQFRAGSIALSNDAKAVLNSAAAQINANPDCRVRVIGYGTSDKKAQQLSWDRVNAVIRYLVEQQGVSENRFIFQHGVSDGDANTVDLQPTTEEGPNTVPAPHPNLRKSK
jgi:outer membrane protein OmpA-like peptidoglycan-associated protein